MNLLVTLLQLLLGLLPFRLPAVVPVRAVRRSRGGRVAYVAGGWRESAELGSLGLHFPQNVGLGSYVLACLLPGVPPAQMLRAERRRNQRPVYEPGSPGEAS